MTTPLILHAAPAAGFDEPFELLAACHQRVERMLGLLQRLQPHLQAHGADRAGAEAARDLLRYFDLAAPHHHEDEERHVLPVLQASANVALPALALRLKADHRAMTVAWAGLRPSLARLEQGHWPEDDAAAQFIRWAAFDALYRDHLAAEDGMAYPEVSKCLTPRMLVAMGDEMARRRGAR
jgi:hemerythrin-like domain-containing protein